MSILSRPIIGLRIGERLQSPEPPAPSCSITLTTDHVGAFGISPAQIDGRRVFIDSVNDQDNYGATTDLDNPTSFWSTGTRWIEAQDVSETGSKPAAAFVEPSGARVYQVVWTPAALSWEFRIAEPAGTVIASNYVNSSISENVAIGMDSNGDCRAVINGTEIDLTTEQDDSSGTLSEFDAFWSGDVSLAGLIDSDGQGVTPRSGSVTIATDGSNYNNDFSGITGTNQDWCGNEI